MGKKLLTIENLSAFVLSNEKKQIIKNLTLTIKEKEVHVIMGPNGSGKSTLSKIIAGHPSYEVETGNLLFEEDNLINMDPVIRAHKGIFLAFQYPLEIAGVTNFDFLRLAYNEKQKYFAETELNPIEFFEFLQEKITTLQIPKEFLYRNVNEGFSGGEKKRNEILQMVLLQPKLVVLDEIDSGLDIDALKFLGTQIRTNLPQNSSLVIITHYPKLLHYLTPTHVHIFLDGKIQKTGGLEIVEQLEKEGYSSFF